MIDGVTVLANEVVTTSCAVMNIIGYILIGLLILGFISFIIMRPSKRIIIRENMPI